MNKEKKQIYKDPKQPIEKRVNDLLKRMTIEEKVAQLGSWRRNEKKIVKNRKFSFEEAKKFLKDGIGELSYSCFSKNDLRY